MGLDERRRIKELQEVTIPERVREIEEICGTPIPYEIDWESLANDAAGLNFIDNLSCSMSINFDGGVLEMHCAYAHGTSGMYGDDEIRNLLLAGL